MLSISSKLSKNIRFENGYVYYTVAGKVRRYRIGSETGFELFSRFLRDIGTRFTMAVGERSLISYDGERFFYHNPLTGAERTYTPEGRVGSFYVRKLQESLSA